MTLRPYAVLGLVVLCFGAAQAAGPAPPLPASGVIPKARTFINGVLDSGQFLPDTTVLCRVGPRVTRVKDFVELYFYSYAEDRPSGDSAGRVQFLDALVNKALLGMVAREINPPMRFEDRTTLREHQQRVLSNFLYERSVSDSTRVTDAEIAREYETYKHHVRLRRIIFADRATAERVRLDLVRGRIPWKQAYEKYSTTKSKDKAPDGEQGWLARGSVDLWSGRKIFTLAPGGISDVLELGDGFNVAQVLERREIMPPSLDAVRVTLREQLASEKVGAYANEIRALVRKKIGMTYDSTNIAWAAAHFVEVRSAGASGTNEFSFNVSLPEFAPGDTSKVLARWKDGVFTLGGFFHMYSDIQPLMRPSVNTFESMRNQVDGFVFEPYLAQVAIDRGFEKDPEVIRRFEEKREQLMVQRVYEDSVMSRVSVTSKARRKYYDDHVNEFVTYSRVRFASLWAAGRGAADSLAARLKAGEKAEDILRADSLLGIQRGSIQDRSDQEHFPNKRVVMEELRPGQVTVTGPSKDGDYIIYQSLEFVPGRQLPYGEAEMLIDESLQNIESERLLKEFIDRHRKKYATMTRPDLVMKIKLVDPAGS